MESPRVAVFGASGALGGRVAARLSRFGIPQRLIVRDPSRAPALPGAQVAAATYLDRPAMVSALDGIDAVFFVSGFEAEDRLAHHQAAIDAFVAAGVSRVVYTSFLGAAPQATFTLARQHYWTEEYLAAAGVRFTALRNSLYADLLSHFAADGVMRGPAGDGRFAPVSRDDIADVAAALLVDPAWETARLDVTGTELVTMTDVAALLSEAIGRPVTFLNETIDEAFASRAHYGAPAFEVEGWVTSYLAIAKGEMEVVSDTVARIAGHPPASLRAVLTTGT